MLKLVLLPCCKSPNKTSFLYKLQKAMKADDQFIKNNLADICASYQHHIVTYLLSKLKLAAEQYDVKDIALAGGVSANRELRKRFQLLSEDLKIRSHIPKFEYCTDNAAMIGIAGSFKLMDKQFADYRVSSKPRLYL